MRDSVSIKGGPWLKNGRQRCHYPFPCMYAHAPAHRNTHTKAEVVWGKTLLHREQMHPWYMWVDFIVLWENDTRHGRKHTEWYLLCKASILSPGIFSDFCFRWCCILWDSLLHTEPHRVPPTPQQYLQILPNAWKRLKKSDKIESPDAEDNGGRLMKWHQEGDPEGVPGCW